MQNKDIINGDVIINNNDIVSFPLRGRGLGRGDNLVCDEIFACIVDELESLTRQDTRRVRSAQDDKLKCHSEAFLPTAPILENIFSCHSERSEESQKRLPCYTQDDRTKTSYSPNTLFPYYLKKKSAFTLAEVLITLGVIGVVAALVMPGVIRNYQRRALQTAFMHADAVIQEALKQNAIDYGYVSHVEFVKSFSNYEALNEFMPEVRKNILSHLKVLGQNPYMPLCQFEAKKFFGEYGGLYCYVNSGSYNITNGMAIRVLNNSYSGGPARLVVYVDTNGPYKGPNRDGYDMFYIGFQGVYRFGCNPLGSGSTITYDCSDYARANVSPYGKGDYWNDFLWKSREELQKMKDGE